MNKNLRVVLIVILILAIGLGYILFADEIFNKGKAGFIKASSPTVIAYTEEGKTSEITRGEGVIYFDGINKDIDDKKLIKIKYSEEEFYIEKDNITVSLDDIVSEEIVYVRTPLSIVDVDDSIIGFGDKGDELNVVGYDELLKNGEVNNYKVKVGEAEGYVNGEYVLTSQEESLLKYMPEVYEEMHLKAEDKYGGGNAMTLDYYPNEKPSFEGNVMPEDCYSLYLTSDYINPKSVKPFIDFAEDTKINTFVVDIKDNFVIGYPAKAMKQYSISAYEVANNSYEEYKEAVKMLKDAGFYVVGRITVFKDDLYAMEHPENCIADVDTGDPIKYQGSYWPSPYSREVWEYNVALAKESVLEIGYNEINFDYCRFPSRISNIESTLDMHNTYDEDKVQAIQRFLLYAKDAMHKINSYISVDVFGETSNGTYTTSYGQYWPAMSNVVDVISGMPYPDHFGAGSYGLSKPWNEPYALIYNWGLSAKERQKECPTPGKVRTWIQAYNVLDWVDPYGINYNADELEAEIRGLYDAGIGDGYITWIGGPYLSKYELQKGAFLIDYESE